mmetsp:Transcript_12555/g.15137  ORF Transcript_12555/g.15137 Transcript_12555/m.15137 type:complete len:203 (-) Transcript_12555:27-635(-)
MIFTEGTGAALASEQQPTGSRCLATAFSTFVMRAAPPPHRPHLIHSDPHTCRVHRNRTQIAAYQFSPIPTFLAHVTMPIVTPRHLSLLPRCVHTSPLLHFLATLPCEHRWLTILEIVIILLKHCESINLDRPALPLSRAIHNVARVALRLPLLRDIFDRTASTDILSLKDIRGQLHLSSVLGITLFMMLLRHLLSRPLSICF